MADTYNITDMSREQINARLHHYNLHSDMSVFSDVPEQQFVQVMYPSVLRFGMTDEQFKAKLAELFGQASVEGAAELERKRNLNKLYGKIQ